MQSFKSSFLQDLSARGLLYQGTHLEELDALAAKGPISLYIGFDATAPSLHVGHLMPIMVLRIAQRHGHKPIVIMGGGTTKLGDPSFKDTARPLLSEETIHQNIESIRKIFSRYLRFGQGASDAIMMNNDEWLGKLNYLDFLRDYGRHFSVNRMLTFEGVKLRLEREQSLSFLEFNYMILQGYDFLELYRRYNCVLQLGGSDQWGNILNGVELIRRVDGKEAFGLRYPLLTSCRPLIFGSFGAVEDSDIDLDKDKTGQELNKLKIGLADDVTSRAHGDSFLEPIRVSLQEVLEGAPLTIEVTGHDTKGNPILKTGFPVVQMSANSLKEGVFIFDLMTYAGFSKGEARRFPEWVKNY